MIFLKRVCKIVSKLIIRNYNDANIKQNIKLIVKQLFYVQIKKKQKYILNSIFRQL